MMLTTPRERDRKGGRGMVRKGEREKEEGLHGIMLALSARVQVAWILSTFERFADMYMY